MCPRTKGEKHHAHRSAIDRDFYEPAGSTNAYGGKGSRIQVSACVADIGDDECRTSTWIGNDS
ncbi:hypothetical protein OOK43_00415 [[Kitasatospora] papulosa]|uniref:hypothetical protein n=1 Tax=Streptomyces TaxID=1883 RepID=UPI00106EB7BB|nr:MULTISPECIES: hypothetical protein [Streptomyces]MCX4411741.1 hypothetical protein [[Kitasatospora] papulosa]QBR08167.1 hypothetical protein D7Y56_20900 [Streptomyces sp. S501]